MGKPTDFPELLTLDEGTELYTQRPTAVSTPENRRFSLLTLRNWLRSALSKLYFRADGPLVNEYEFTLGGAFNWHGERGLETRLDANHIYTRPIWDTPVDGQVWTYDEATDQMELRDADADKHTHIDVSLSAIWNLEHDLGFVPNYILKDTTGNILHGQRETIDLNNERVTFATARAGYADFT